MGDDGIEPQQCETQGLRWTVVQLRADPPEETFVAGCPFNGGPVDSFVQALVLVEPIGQLTHLDPQNGLLLLERVTAASYDSRQ